MCCHFDVLRHNFPCLNYIKYVWYVCMIGHYTTVTIIMLLYVTVEMMLRVCLQQIMGIHERQVATEDNMMLRQVHQRIFQEMVCKNYLLLLSGTHCIFSQAFDVLLEAWTNLWH